MTVDRILIPGLTDAESDTLNRLLEKLAAKQPRNLLRASYYDGKRAIRQVGSVIPPQYYRLGIVLGWSAKAVDILARRCNLDGFVWPDGELSDLGLRDSWEGNHLGTEVSSGIISALIHGTSFLINTRGDESNAEPVGLIHVKDAMSATGDWNPRTRRLDNLLSITGRDNDGKVNAFALYLDNLTITAERDASGWQVDKSDHPWGVPAEPLVYKPRVGRPFGQSRISRTTMSLHDQGLRTVIRMEGHLDVYSFPEMWMLGADMSIFQNSDGTQQAAWQVMLGRIKGIPDDEDAANPRADVKQFPAASPTPHLDALKAQAGIFAGEHHLPVTTLGIQAQSNSTTEDGSDNAERELISEAEGATDDFGPAIRRAFARSLAMQNGLDTIPAEWSTIDTQWRSPVYLSRAAEADAGAKQLGAVPWLAETEVGLRLLGLGEQDIKLALAERRRLGGSAALRAITEAAAEGRPAVMPAAPEEDAASIRAKADAMGVLIRSGVDAESAAAAVGFAGMKFTGAVPASLRLPETEASKLEGGDSGPVGNG